MTTRNRRPAFTLMEMMIVLAIIVVVAAIMIPASLALTDRSFVPKGASMLESALALAKTRAVAERRPNGIRLVAADLGRRQTVSGQAFAWYDQIQFIEDPGDYVEGFVWGVSDVNVAVPQIVPFPQPWWSHNPPISPLEKAIPNPGDVPLGVDLIDVAAGPFTYTALVDTGGTVTTVTVPRSRLLMGPISLLTPAANQWTALSSTVYKSQRFNFSYIDRQNASVSATVASLQGAVQPGDKVEILGTGEIYTVVSVSAQISGGMVSSLNVNISGVANKQGPITVPLLELDRPLSNDIIPPINGRPNFRVIRQPRAVPAMQPIKLPQEVVIDLTPTRTNMVPPVPDVDVNSSIYMSGVSSGIGITNITGLTVAPGSPPTLIAPLYVDIMFSPSGELVPTTQQFGDRVVGPMGAFNTGPLDILAIWLHAYGDPNLWAGRQPTAAQGNADNQALVAVHARTGMIGSYQVGVPTTYADPLYFVRNGIGRKSSDTGP